MSFQRVGFILISLIAIGLSTLLLIVNISTTPIRMSFIGPYTILLNGVVLAARDIPKGTKLRPNDVTVRRIPADKVPTFAVSSPAYAINRTARVDIKKHEPLNINELDPRPLGFREAVQPVETRRVDSPAD